MSKRSNPPTLAKGPTKKRARTAAEPGPGFTLFLELPEDAQGEILDHALWPPPYRSDHLPLEEVPRSALGSLLLVSKGIYALTERRMRALVKHALELDLYTMYPVPHSGHHFWGTKIGQRADDLCPYSASLARACRGRAVELANRFCEGLRPVPLHPFLLPVAGEEDPRAWEKVQQEWNQGDAPTAALVRHILGFGGHDVFLASLRDDLLRTQRTIAPGLLGAIERHVANPAVIDVLVCSPLRRRPVTAWNWFVRLAVHLYRLVYASASAACDSLVHVLYVDLAFDVYLGLFHRTMAWWVHIGWKSSQGAAVLVQMLVFMLLLPGPVGPGSLRPVRLRRLELFRATVNAYVGSLLSARWKTGLAHANSGVATATVQAFTLGGTFWSGCGAPHLRLGHRQFRLPPQHQQSALWLQLHFVADVVCKRGIVEERTGVAAQWSVATFFYPSVLDFYVECFTPPLDASEVAALHHWVKRFGPAPPARTLDQVVHILCDEVRALSPALLIGMSQHASMDGVVPSALRSALFEALALALRREPALLAQVVPTAAEFYTSERWALLGSFYFEAALLPVRGMTPWEFRWALIDARISVQALARFDECWSSQGFMEAMCSPAFSDQRPTTALEAMIEHLANHKITQGSTSLRVATRHLPRVEYALYCAMTHYEAGPIVLPPSVVTRALLTLHDYWLARALPIERPLRKPALRHVLSRDQVYLVQARLVAGATRGEWNWSRHVVELYEDTVVSAESLSWLVSMLRVHGEEKSRISLGPLQLPLVSKEFRRLHMGSLGLIMSWSTEETLAYAMRLQMADTGI